MEKKGSIVLGDLPLSIDERRELTDGRKAERDDEKKDCILLRDLALSINESGELTDGRKSQKRDMPQQQGPDRKDRSW